MFRTHLVTALVAGMLLIPAIPPIFFPFFEPYTFGKTILFEILVELVFLLWLFTRPTPIPTRSDLVGIGVAVFAAVAILSTLFSSDIYRSFWGSSARGDGLFALAHFFILFAVLVFSSKWLSENWWKNMFRLSVGASFFTAIYGALQWLGLPWVQASNGAIFSTLGNPAYFAIYLIANIFLAIHLARAERERHDARTLLYIIAIFETLVVLFTGVRAAILGLALGALIATVPMFRGRTSKHGLGIMVFGALALSALLYGCFFSPLCNDPTIQSRLYVWDVAAERFAEHPLLGSGPNNFEVFAPQTGESFDKPHNAFLETLVSYGLVGLLAYFFLWYAAFRQVQKAFREPKDRYLWYGLGGAYAVFLFFFFDTFASLLMFFLILAFLARSREVKTTTPIPTRSDLVGIGVALVIWTIVFSLLHFKPLTNAYWARSFFIYEQKTGELDPALKERALYYDAFNKIMIGNSIKALERDKKARGSH